MRTRLALRGALLLSCVGVAHGANAPAGAAAPFSRDKIVEAMRKVQGYQLAHPWRRDDRDWIRATYYTGVMALYETTKDPRVLDQAVRWARKHDWAEGSERSPANKMTCGQTWLQLYFLKNDPAMIAKMRAYVDGRIEKAGRRGRSGTTATPCTSARRLWPCWARRPARRSTSTT